MAQRTNEVYVHDAAYFSRWAHDQGADPEHATHQDVLAFIAWYGGRCSQSSVVRRFAAIRYYFRWLIERGVRGEDPTEGIRLKHPDRPAKEPFSPEELRRLLAACRRPQERAILLLLIDTGLRLGEVTGIRQADVDFGKGLIHVRGKTGERLVAPGALALKALARCMGNRDYPWYSQRLHAAMTNDGFYRLLRRLGKRTGIPNVHARRFRTSWACTFLDETDDAGSAQVLMGHAKIETTLAYGSWTKVRRAIDQARRHSLADRLAG